MKRILSCALAALALALAGAAPTEAQQGLALKGSAVFNRSHVGSDPRQVGLSDAHGFNVGAELVLPGGLGVGVSGYTAGSPRSFDLGSGSLVVLGEANYFLRLLPLVSPYAGVHVGLGTYDLGDVQQGVRPQVDLGDLGYQLGVRVQLSRQLGLDAQLRKVSGSVRGAQDAGFEDRQVLVGVALF